MRMKLEAGTAGPGVFEGEVSLDGISGHGVTIAVVNPPAPGWQIVLHTDVVPLVGERGLTLLLQPQAVTQSEAGHEGKFGEC